MARQKNPRREVLAMVRRLRDISGTLITIWDQEQSWTDYRAPRDEYGNYVRTKRADEDKIENKPEEWRRLANYAAWMQNKRHEIEQYAERQEQLARERM